MLQLTTILFLIAASILSVIHIIALKLFLYWRFEWFDIPMHALGGAVVALGVFTAYDLRLFKNKVLLKVLPVMGAVLTMAGLWEVYDIMIGFPVEENYTLDTTLDIIMGLIGGYVGYLVANNIRKLN